METISYVDLSLTIKYGVQFGLFGMSVAALGTEKHHQLYLNRIGTLDLPGCFAMTETGHGSNVKGIEHDRYLSLRQQDFYHTYSASQCTKGIYRQCCPAWSAGYCFCQINHRTIISFRQSLKPRLLSGARI